jgi:DNA-binding FrmR family transcriptional regulator
MEDVSDVVISLNISAGRREEFVCRSYEEHRSLVCRHMTAIGLAPESAQDLTQQTCERALDQEAECSDILHNISACRAAMDALMTEVMEGHIQYHVLAQNGTATDEQTRELLRRRRFVNSCVVP